MNPPKPVIAQVSVRQRGIILLMAVSLLASSLAANAQVISEPERASVPLQAEANAGGEEGMVRLSWQPPSANLAWASTSVYRRAFPPAPTKKGWGEPLAVLDAGETGYLDAPPESPRPWEYRVVALENGTGRTAYGYAVVAASQAAQGAELDPEKALLVLISEDLSDKSGFKGPLNFMRIARAWEAGGWVVEIEKVSTETSTVDVRHRVITRAQKLEALGISLKSVILLGHVPVPYSGNFAPDGHGDHWGAWPTDLYYGDLNGTWPDERDFPKKAADIRQHNGAGDGKFDLNELPGPVRLSVGRVDFSSLAALDLANGATPTEAHQLESERTIAWLERVCDWHEGKYPIAGAEVLMHDMLPANPEAFATTPWRLAPLLAPKSDMSVNPLCVPMLAGGDQTGRILFGFGYAPGTYTSAMGIASSAELLEHGLRIPFVFLFGSYFGDWDAPGNLLQAALGNAKGGVLATSWAARPVWQLHPMAAGYTIGDCQLLTANRTQEYLPGLREAFPTHLELLGDPTLDLYPLPLAVLETEAEQLPGRTMRWKTDQVQDLPPRPPALKAEPRGWHVYFWRQNPNEPIMAPVRITKNALPLATDHFRLPARSEDALVLGCQVRLLYRIQTPSGPIERLGPGRVVRLGAVSDLPQ